MIWEFELPRLVNIINHTEKVARRYGVMTFDWSVSMNSRDSLSLSLRLPSSFLNFIKTYDAYGCGAKNLSASPI